MIAGAGVFSLAGPALPAAEDLKLIPENVSLWDASLAWDGVFDIRTGLGYKDNVLLSPFQPAGSPFFVGNVQATVMRLPLNGWQFSFFLQGEDIRYFHPVLNVDHEETLMALAQVKLDIGSAWQASATLLYYYVDQVQDVSALEADVISARVLGQNVTFRPGLRRELAALWWLELQVPVARQFLKTPLDSYWQTGPKLILTKEYGHRSEVRLSFGASRFLYDKHEALDAAGDPLANTHLALWQHKTELDWDHYWDKQHRWRTTTTLGFDVNTDNGQGFFDYRTYRTSEQICYQVGSVTMKGKAAVDYSDYSIRTTGVAGTPPLHRTRLTLDLRAEKQLTKFLKVFGEYEYEQALSNESDEQYRVNTVRGGLEWEF